MQKARHVVLVPTLFTGDWMSDKVDQLPPVAAAKARAVVDIKATQHPVFVMKEGVIYVGGK